MAGTEILTLNGGGQVFVKTQLASYIRGSWDTAQMQKWSASR